ncbi:MAG: hypothetical protein ABSF44_10590 [Candidatus Bathyarchaeia archaeon]|jgi:hypothetical protein
MLSKIDALTSQYRKLIIQPNGGLAIGNDQQNNVMISQNFKAEELIGDFNIFCQLPPFLIRTCIFPGDNTIIMDRVLPFFDLWAVKTIHYFSHHPKFMVQNKGAQNFDFDSNLELFESLLLLGLESERYDILRRDTPLGKVISESSEKLLPCFVYPLLESVVRNGCNGILNPDGTIANITAFSALPAKKKKFYEEHLRQNPKFQVSNIGDELLLLTKASKNPFRATIDATIKEFAICVNSPKEAYATIMDARNGILHGDKISSRGAIAVKYIIFLLCLSKISEEEYKKEFHRLQHYQMSFW